MTITVAPCQEIIRLRTMEDLRRIFPTPDAVNMYNQVLFSTSGIHGSYCTIEEAERVLREGRTPETEGYFTESMPDRPETYKLTVLVLQPRCVTMCFGDIPVRLADIPYLKELRARSWAELVKIGAPSQNASQDDASAD